ncbi:MAG: PEP-CTERM sorting domain-containing protein [Candidatus Accumulibacter sp.]|uniref:PEP-CTERM sorting domain-containing protein n=1 Tax=Accumulibacter sp. TaxID=2053492 RepID=UPI00258484BC|nr:PEP-CTERM sorting domain-containing protein [Accumulibacter sp.]MCM8622767.1 PEP-CTERM sorting domain-containing protein [Accumulibacter sp.]
MRKISLRIAALLVGLSASAAALAVPTYTYVGFWDVFSGQAWDDIPPPPTYTGQQAAAAIFNGSPSDYVISTIDNDKDHINNMAWVDTYGIGLQQVAESHSVDSGGSGYDTNGDTSAWVQDNGGLTAHINYAFRIDNNNNRVPEPVSLALVGLGFFGIGAARRRSTV